MRNFRAKLICLLLLSGVLLFAWLNIGVRPIITIPTDRRVIDLDFRPGPNQLAICELADTEGENALTVVDFDLNPPAHSASHRANAHHCDWSDDGSRLMLSSGWWNISCLSADSFQVRWSAEIPAPTGLSPSAVGNEAVAIVTQGPIGEFAPTPPSQPVLMSQGSRQSFATSGFPFCVATFGNESCIQVAVSYEFEPRIEVGQLIRKEDNQLNYQQVAIIPTRGPCFVQYGPDGKKIVVLSTDELSVRDATSGTTLSSIVVQRSTMQPSQQPLSVSRNGLIAVSESNRIVVRRQNDLTPVMTVSGYSQTVALSETGQLLAISRSGPSRVELFDVSSR